MKTALETLKTHMKNYFNHERISRQGDLLVIVAGLMALLPTAVIIKDNPVTTVEAAKAIAETNPVWVAAVTQFTCGCWAVAFTTAIAAAILYKIAHTMLWTEAYTRETAEIVKRYFGNLELPKL